MNSKQYDYIVVGAGSSGCVVANRLSANPATRVLLLEAGRDDNHRWVRMPLGVGKIITNPEFVWPFYTEPDPGLNDSTMYWPRGRMLGGSSSLNGMLFVRGAAHRYDLWRDGNEPGWGFDELLPYFKKIEDRPDGDDTWRGHGGPITVSDASVRDPLSAAFVQACVASGMPEVADYNADRFDGVSWLQYSTRGGERCSAARAYLHPVAGRANLEVLTGAHVSRVILDGRSARGVVYQVGGEEHTAHANAEVVLSAGPIISPKLLELSGIGNSEVLGQHGIDVVHHLPGVGEHLKDHLQSRITYESSVPVTVNDLVNNPLRGAWAGLRYMLRKDGRLATSVATVHAITRSDPTLAHPDLKLQIILFSGKDRYSRSKALGVDPFSGFSIGAFDLYPQSTGSLHIRSADPNDDPIINPNYLSDPRDEAVLLKGIRLIREIAQQSTFDELIVREVRPGPDTRSDEALMDYAKDTAQTCWHPISTCRMGRSDDDVVDFELKVHGIDRLRVIDSSIMPNMPTSNTNAPSLVIGEKGADLILAS